MSDELNTDLLYGTLYMYHNQDVLDFINHQCEKYRIDRSHGLIHSERTFERSREIIGRKLITLREKIIIEYACLLHDMCDKKYMNEDEGIIIVRDFLFNTIKLPAKYIDDILFIISTMSYSKVKKYGVPDFKQDYILERCYYIVRDSDLLESYDLERCIDYHTRNGAPRYEGIKNMLAVYKTRISKLLDDNLLKMPISQNIAKILQIKCKNEIHTYITELREINQLSQEDIDNTTV